MISCFDGKIECWIIVLCLCISYAPAHTTIDVSLKHINVYTVWGYFINHNDCIHFLLPCSILHSHPHLLSWSKYASTSSIATDAESPSSMPRNRLIISPSILPTSVPTSVPPNPWYNTYYVTKFTDWWNIGAVKYCSQPLEVVFGLQLFFQLHQCVL